MAERGRRRRLQPIKRLLGRERRRQRLIASICAVTRDDGPGAELARLWVGEHGTGFLCLAGAWFAVAALTGKTPKQCKRLWKEGGLP